MTHRILAPLVMAMLVIAAQAKAETTIIEPVDSHRPYQRWVDEAKMPTPDVTITIIETEGPHGCPGREVEYVACTSPAEDKIWIAPAAAPGNAREIVYHELGHNVDRDMLPDWMRLRFLSLQGESGQPWNYGGEPEIYGPNEQFADAYAQCSLHPYLNPRRPHLGLGPFAGAEPVGSYAGHNAICRMLARL